MTPYATLEPQTLNFLIREPEFLPVTQSFHGRVNQFWMWNYQQYWDDYCCHFCKKISPKSTWQIIKNETSLTLIISFHHSIALYTLKNELLYPWSWGFKDFIAYLIGTATTQFCLQIHEFIDTNTYALLQAYTVYCMHACKLLAQFSKIVYGSPLNSGSPPWFFLSENSSGSFACDSKNLNKKI